MPKGTRIVYTAAELAFVEQRRAMERSELTKLFNEHFGRNLSVAALSALCKRKGWLTGRSGCFKKGCTTWNKGSKGLVKPNSGNFRKGSRPHNTAKIGDEVVAKGWVKIKIAEPDVWKNKSLWVWEQKNGSLPKGMLLIHIDGDFTNSAIDNLYPITRADLLALNRKGFSEKPIEVRKTMIAVARLQNIANQKERQS